MIVTSPEVLIFLFFMITDPKTVPAGRVGRIVFGFLVAVASVLLMAPQTDEFGTKVGLLAGLVVDVRRPAVARPLPARAASRPRDRSAVFASRAGGRRSGRTRASARVAARVGARGGGVFILGAGIVAAGTPARGTRGAGHRRAAGRRAARRRSGDAPAITVDVEAWYDYDHELADRACRRWS